MNYYCQVTAIVELTSIDDYNFVNNYDKVASNIAFIDLIDGEGKTLNVTSVSSDNVFLKI